MTLHIKTIGFSLSQALRGTVKSRLRLALSRYEAIIKSVDVTLSDVNGADKGGVDKRCQIIVRLSKSKLLLVQETESDMYDAIQICTQKMHRSLSRYIGKRSRIQRDSIRFGNMPLEAA